MWEEFYARGIMGLAWGEIGDLTTYAHKEDLKAQMLQTYPENGTLKNAIHALWQFANEMKPGDVVFVKKGRSEILGRGVVAGDYVYDAEGSDFRSETHPAGGPLGDPTVALRGSHHCRIGSTTGNHVEHRVVPYQAVPARRI